MSLSVNRLRRPNAGSKMSALLVDEENKDHFYDNIYGGFQEDDNDIDFITDDSDYSEDTVDSDFSIDETQDPLSDEQNEDESKPKTKTKKKLGFIQSKQKPIQSKPKTSQTIKTKIGVPLEVDIPLIKPIFSAQISTPLEKTFSNEKIIQNRLKFGENNLNIDSKVTQKTKTKAKECVKEWTQKELLEESLITEKINLKSLKDWEYLELERTQKTKPDKHLIKGPFIRYHSVTMPLIEELDPNPNDETPVDDEKEKHYSRTFISFSDEQTFDSLFKSFKSSSSAKPSVDAICPITKIKARYWDPISQMPFADINAFNVIRNKYNEYLEDIYGNGYQNEDQEWIQSNNKWKEWQQKYLSYNNQELSAIADESQKVQNLPLLPKTDPIRRVSGRSGRKGKKF